MKHATPIALLAAALAAAVSAQDLPAPAAPERSLAGDCAAVVLDGAPGVRWIVADGPLVPALRAAVAAKGLDAVVLPLLGGDEATLARADEVAASTVPPAARRALAFGVPAFLRAWLDADPAAVRTNLLFAAPPAAIESAGFVAVPDALGYRAVAPADVAAALPAAAESFAAARDALGEAVSTATDPKAVYAPEVAPYRALAGQAGDRLGCLLVRAGETNAALEVFLAADSAYPPGASAALNAASLVRRGVRPAAGADVARRLEAIVRGGERWTLWAEGGPVLEPADFFETGWYWTVSGLSPFGEGAEDALKAALDAVPESDRPAVAARLVQALRPATALAAAVAVPAEDAPEAEIEAAASFLFYRGERVRADRLLRAAAADAADPADRLRALLARASLLATAGNAAKADSLLQDAFLASTNAPAPAFAFRELCLRGRVEAQMEALDLPAARLRLLALAAENGAFSDWAAKASAAVAAVEAGDFARANESAAGAVEAAAAVPAEGFAPSWAPLRLRAFLALQTGDLRAAAEAAAALLEARGGHDFFGHYVSALAAQAAGDAAKADLHFQASLAERAVWFVLNDFAVALDARGSSAPAVMFARQAVASGGAEQAAVQDTLGMALLHAGDLAGALEAMRAASALPGGDAPAIRLDLAETLSENGLFDELAEVLKSLEAALAVADETIRERAARLREVLAAQAE